ncbi:MAG: TIGR02147 family protein [Oligoflexales bacterium]
MQVKSRKLVQEGCTLIDITNYIDIKQYLLGIYKIVKFKLGSYSYAKYTKDLGLTPSCNLSLVINGSLTLSPKNAAKIARVLDIHQDQRRYFTTLVKYTYCKNENEREDLFQQLLRIKNKIRGFSSNKLMSDYYSLWFNPIIRELISLDDFDGTPEWIRSRITFPLSNKQIKESLNLLEKLKLVKKDKNSNRYIKVVDKIESDDKTDILSIINFHYNTIDMGKAAITRIPANKREIRSLTFTIPNGFIDKVKKEIALWMDQLLKLEETAKNSQDKEVFQFNVQFFPFTENKGE